MSQPQVGDKVTRMLAGTIPMELTIAFIDNKFIYCGPKPVEGESPENYAGWKFDKTYGYEVDEDLGWGIERPGGIITGSYIKLGGDDERDREQNQTPETETGGNTGGNSL